jgi:hypothetical protein
MATTCSAGYFDMGVSGCQTGGNYCASQSLTYNPADTTCIKGVTCPNGRDPVTNSCIATTVVPSVSPVPPVDTGISVSTVGTAVMISLAMPYFFKGFLFGISLLFPIQGARFLIKRIYK